MYCLSFSASTDLSASSFHLSFSSFEHHTCGWASQVALVVKNAPANAGDASSISGSGRFPGKGMATHSSVLTWRSPWTEEPRGLPSMGSQRLGHDWSNLACMHACRCSARCPAVLVTQHWQGSQLKSHGTASLVSEADVSQVTDK